MTEADRAVAEAREMLLQELPKCLETLARIAKGTNKKLAHAAIDLLLTSALRMREDLTELQKEQVKHHG